MLYNPVESSALPKMPMRPSEPVKFLIVDDDTISVMAIKRQMRQQEIENPSVVARDGIEALEVLRGDRGFDQLVHPYIVLLDLNMPRMGGLEFLSQVRLDPDLRRIMIFVMTTSDAEKDIANAYDFNVAGYFLKDHVSGSFAKILKVLERYSEKVILPL